MEQEILKQALKEFYERKYKLYKQSNDVPVTDEDFESLKEKATEIRTIKEIAEKYGAI